MARTLTYSFLLILVMAVVSAGEWVPRVGTFFHELAPIVAFFLYLGLGYIAGSKLRELPTSGRVLVACSLLAHFLLYSTPYLVGYYMLPSDLAKSMTKERGAEVSYSEAAAALSSVLEKETGLHGVPAYAVFSERRSLTAANVKDYVARQFEDVDDLGPLLAAIVNTVLHTLPVGLKWLLTDRLEIVREPGYIGLVFWYLAAFGFYGFGFRKGVE